MPALLAENPASSLVRRPGVSRPCHSPPRAGAALQGLRAQQPTQRSPCELASYGVRVRDELDAGRLDGVADARTHQRRDLSGMVVSHLIPRQRRGLHVYRMAVELVEG